MTEDQKTSTIFVTITFHGSDLPCLACSAPSLDNGGIDQQKLAGQGWKKSDLLLDSTTFAFGKHVDINILYRGGVHNLALELLEAAGKCCMATVIAGRTPDVHQMYAVVGNKIIKSLAHCKEFEKSKEEEVTVTVLPERVQRAVLLLDQ